MPSQTNFIKFRKYIFWNLYILLSITMNLHSGKMSDSIEPNHN